MQPTRFGPVEPIATLADPNDRNPQMRLIVTEKNNSAKKIAEILGGSPKADKSYKVPFYTWSDGDGEHMAIGLKGHVLNPAFPEDYSNWQKTERAFSELDELSYPLAHAGWARQDIDLLWGATLTRAVSLATRRFGSNFLSVGRVQSPTLALIVERELERRAHKPKPFWEVL